jgi:DNA-binding IclR family transcriptional regulator
LSPYTEHTITDRDALAVEIERVRERGWARAPASARRS